MSTQARRQDRSLPELDRMPDPWESSMQATCECLSWRGALDNLERRHTEDRLGETVYVDYPVQARSALVVAHLLIEQGILDEQELRSKMAQVRARLEDV
ncbi:nitrile hydratase subunit beta [Dactylosporangium sp. NBC_01737]|uniref:hypothetical protein n=1 Tax=Dactylosporangium sp. NBC_01737 TaxID=2975959 RepID=UPI002E0F0FF1|nr:nitrile hydratase subunit beta [Dactylosporangium sp. NBC_01737]